MARDKRNPIDHCSLERERDRNEVVDWKGFSRAGREGGREREREREAACTFDWKNSSNQEASRLSIPKDRGSHVRARARACEYERASVEYRAEKGAPPLSLSLVSRPVRGAAALLLLLRFSPYGPHRSSHALSPLPRIPPVITPLLPRHENGSPSCASYRATSPIPLPRLINKRFSSSILLLLLLLLLNDDRRFSKRRKLVLLKIWFELKERRDRSVRSYFAFWKNRQEEIRRYNRRVTRRRNNYSGPREKARTRRRNLIRALERVFLEPLERRTFSRERRSQITVGVFLWRERSSERESSQSDGLQHRVKPRDAIEPRSIDEKGDRF